LKLLREVMVLGGPRQGATSDSPRRRRRSL
jgi:hypothetical protein